MPATTHPETTAPRTVPVRDVEIFAVGEHRDGAVYTAADLDRMVDNFERCSEWVSPTNAVGHAEDQTWLEDSGYPSAGRVARVWRDGNILRADLADVPPLIARLIESRTYKTVSAEVYDDFVDPAGKHHGKTLRRVAFLGAELPQVKTIAELPEKYFGQGADEFCDPCHRKAVLRYQETRSTTGGFFRVFSEVKVMKRNKLARFSERCKATFKKFADEPMPEGVAPPPPEVTHDDLVAMLTEYGFDPGLLAGITDDAVLAEIVRVCKSSMAPMAQPGAMNAEPTPPIVPGNAPVVPSPMPSNIPGVPDRTPSQVTLKFGEKDVNLDQVLKPLIDAAVSAAVKPIQAQLASAEGSVAKFQETSRKADIDAKWDLWLRQGRVIPAQEEAVKKRLYRANGIQKFADGKTELDLQIEEIEAGPLLLKFAELAKGTKPGSGNGKPGEDTDPEVQEVQRFAESNAAAFRTAGLKADKFVETFKKKRAANPEYAAAQYIGAK